MESQDVTKEDSLKATITFVVGIKALNDIYISDAGLHAEGSSLD
jgi:hypothetical protein